MLDCHELPETKVKSDTVYQGKMINFRVDQVRLPSGGTSSREVVEHPGSVGIIPIDKDGNAILIRQFRYAVGEVLWEIPAGKLDPGESPKDCAMRELEEETSYLAGRLEKIASFYTSPGFSSEMLHLFIGTDLASGTARPDDDENIGTYRLSREAVETMVKNGEIRDAKTLLGLATVISRGLF
ncbi:MAG TPA: NUDIX hydrolase [Firmicutes bacterium]|jgi:ADP-ribose pyrophosphatase|nr:NUDIX hydrolase [Bacillota bacterium]